MAVSKYQLARYLKAEQSSWSRYVPAAARPPGSPPPGTGEEGRSFTCQTPRRCGKDPDAVWRTRKSATWDMEPREPQLWGATKYFHGSWWFWLLERQQEAIREARSQNVISSSVLWIAAVIHRVLQGGLNSLEQIAKMNKKYLHLWEKSCFKMTSPRWLPAPVPQSENDLL